MIGIGYGVRLVICDFSGRECGDLSRTHQAKLAMSCETAEARSHRLQPVVP